MSSIVPQGVETVDTNTFITEENREKLENAKKTNSVEVNPSPPQFRHSSVIAQFFNAVHGNRLANS
jgi:hypothetical protein